MRKASLPEIRPLVTVNELDVDAIEAARLPRPHTALDRAPQDENGSCVRTEASRTEVSDAQLRNLAKRHVSLGTKSSSKPPTTVFELHSHGGRLRTRERPNLRIAINKDRSDDKPLPLPPKSPEYPRNYPENTASVSPARQSGAIASSGRPVTPVHVAQQQSVTPVSGDVKVAWPAVPGRRASIKRAPSPMHNLLSGDLSSKRTPRAGDFNSASSDVSGRATAAVEQPHRLTLRSRLLSREKPTQTVNVRPTTPEGRRTNASKDWTDLVRSAPLMNRRSVTPDPSFGRPDDAGMLSVKDIFLNATRPGSSRSVREHDSTAPHPTLSKPAPENTVPTSLSRSAGAALAAARANVAALRNTDSLGGSPEHVKTPASVLGTFSRSTADLLCRRPSSPGPGDPVMILKELSEQYETLHARYASLRADRQKLSSSIIESLKEQKPGPDYVNTLLADQLTLAATSSSMDVCFARLKSLDCRREDAIAALVAKASQLEMSPTDNIAAMIASMAVSRKGSGTTESSRYAPTGRSTPDYGEGYGYHRSTQPSLRTVSYGSEGEGMEDRSSSLSRQSSAGGESNYYAESTERQAPETILEVLESPQPTRVTHELETVHNPNEWKSSHPSLPSVTKHEPVWALDAVVGSGAINDTTRLGTSGSDGSLDALLGPHKPRVEGAKAAKVLGLLDQSLDDKDILMLKIPDLLSDALKKDTNAERDREDAFYNAKQHSTSLLLVLPDDVEDPVSPDTGDLDLQLQSFPRPQRLSSLPSPNKRDTAGSMLTNGSSAESSNGEQDTSPPPRSGRGMTKTASISSAKAGRKRDPSAHTIQVYLEQDDILEYYDGAYRSRRT